MNSGLKKFFGIFLCAALALALAAGSVFGVGIWKAVRQIADETYQGYLYYDAAYMIADAIRQGQDNLFLTCGETLSAPNPDDLTVDFAIRALPFEIAGGGSAEAFVRGDRIPLRLRDGVLEGSARVPLAGLSWNENEGSLEYRILLQGGGVQKNQMITPEIYITQSPALGWIDMDWDAPYKGTLNLTFQFELYDEFAPFGDLPAKANIYALTYTYGGEGERGQNLMFNAEFENGMLELQEAFEVGNNDLLRFYAEVVGESGMVYRYWLQDFVSPNYESEYDFPWYDEDHEARVPLYIAGTNEQVELW